MRMLNRNPKRLSAFSTPVLTGLEMRSLLYMRTRALGRDWAVCRGLFLGTETTETKREQPKPRREWQYNAEKHKGKASASRV